MGFLLVSKKEIKEEDALNSMYDIPSTSKLIFGTSSSKLVFLQKANSYHSKLGLSSLLKVKNFNNACNTLKKLKKKRINKNLIQTKINTMLKHKT